MNSFSEMDWESESPKKLQLVDWTIMDDGEVDAGSFNLSSGGGNSGASGSDGGHVSSAKSSISASDSSTKEGMWTPDFSLMSFGDFSGNFSKKMELKETKFYGTSSPVEASIGSVEPLIGLKLGKRTYFENSGDGGKVRSTSLPGVPGPSTTTLKKTKSSGQNLSILRCVVEGCNVDLSAAKEYHRKHRVCDGHSKCPKVIVGGLERRFCQQCSRFHNLSEFDEKKRSCRRRLSDHNARRRKPQQEPLQFNSTRVSSSFYGGRQQMSFALNNAPLLHSRNLMNASWDSAYNSKFSLTNGCPSKSNGGGSCEQMHMLGNKLPHLVNAQSDSTNRLLASKSSVSEVLNPGSKGSQFSSSHLDAAPKYGRALSLLSSNSWGSCGPDSMPLNPMHEDNTCVNQPMMHGIPEGVPLSSPEFWPPPHQSTNHRIHSLAMDSNFSEIQLLTTPYETNLYPNILN